MALLQADCRINGPITLGATCDLIIYLIALLSSPGALPINATADPSPCARLCGVGRSLLEQSGEDDWVFCVRRVSFPREVSTVAVRWYLRYGLSYRDFEELLGDVVSRSIT
jgi:hypothetical protein